jgi:cytochrome c peroxidase
VGRRRSGHHGEPHQHDEAPRRHRPDQGADPSARRVPRSASRADASVARDELFDSAELGCRTCHDGKLYTDNEKHKFEAATLGEADTPSLVGLAASAPYYHDGSAATLESLLRDRARVHGMAETAKLTDKQVSDLIAFLETL